MEEYVTSRFLYAVAIAVSTSCATAGGGSAPAAHHDFNLITEDEIAATPSSNAYEVVAKLRPNFLKTRGRTTINAVANDRAVVFLDGQYYGNLNTLRNLLATQIREIRYIGGTDAVTQYGMQYGGGVIAIKTK